MILMRNAYTIKTQSISLCMFSVHNFTKTAKHFGCTVLGLERVKGAVSKGARTGSKGDGTWKHKGKGSGSRGSWSMEQKVGRRRRKRGRRRRQGEKRVRGSHVGGSREQVQSEQGVGRMEACRKGTDFTNHLLLQQSRYVSYRYVSYRTKGLSSYIVII